MSAAVTPFVNLHSFADPGALSAAVAQVFSTAVRAALAQRPRASVVITGGTTPRAYYPALATLDLPWARIDLTLSDERWVPPTHADSNERLVRELLLTGPAAAAQLLSLKNDAPTATRGAAGTAAALARLPHPYDLVLLGFGADTHIASLFPTATAFEAGVDPANDARCLAVVPPAGVNPPVERLSLTLNELMASRRIVIAARGDDKRAAWHAALAGALTNRTPVGLLAQRAQQPVDFFWCP